MFWSIVIHVISALIFAVISPISAVAQTGQLRVGCPASWPGTKDPSAFLVKNDIWEFAVTDVIPDGVVPINARGPETVSLNCHYSNGLRATVVVPGLTSACYFDGDSKAVPPRYTYFCLTRPDADGTMGPIRTYIVEPVTLKTRIDGLGLGMSRAEILDIAKARGYQVIDGDGESLRLRLGSDEATIEFGKITGASRAISIRNSPGDFRRFTETKYRFGLDPEWVHHYPPDKKSFTSKRWKSRTDSAVLENFPTDDPQRNVLRFHDSAAD